MSIFLEFALAVLGLMVAVTALIFIFRYLLWPITKGLGWFMSAIFTFIGRELRDVFRFVGAVLTIIFTVPMLLATLIMGRWSATSHFGEAVKGEGKLLGLSLYRLAIGNFLHSFGMSDVVAGLEERIPQALADAPGADLPRMPPADNLGNKPARAGVFDGYRIVGSLPGGGSGGKLYIAEPDPVKTAVFERNGHMGVTQVVIKSFSTREGSSLPQIVRESRALDAAKRLGLVLDHELKGERFYYVMRYVPGQSLTAVTHQLHAVAAPPPGERGLDDKSLRTALSHVADLLATLDTYHRGGLWHKDVKPDNIIVDGHRAHLVDFGLVTPLRSAMTLTTHGTEYFRDPEMVRMALRGMKVAEVDGTRFDIYGAGAVLYSVIENQFPAHGVLSQINQRCPEALRWIIRRAMTDYDKRYPSAASMLRDLDAIRHAADPMAIKPGMLPSMRDGDMPAVAEPAYDPVIEQVRREPAAAAVVPPPLPTPMPVVPPPLPNVGRADVSAWNPAANPSPHVPPTPPPPRRTGKTAVRVTNWWTGEYVPEGGQAEAQSQRPGYVGSRFGDVPRTPRPEGRRSAAEQLASARARVEAARDRVHARAAARGPLNRSYNNNPNAGVYIGVAAALVLLVFGSLFMVRSERERPISTESITITDNAPAAMNLQATRAGSTPEPLPDVSKDEGHVLVVVSLKTPIAESDRAKISGTVDALRRAGFEVRGNFPDALDDDAATNDVAEILALASSTPLDLPEGRRSIATWAADDGDTDVVVFVRPEVPPGGSSKDVHAGFVVLAAEQHNPSNETRARLTRLTLAASKIASR